MAREIHQALLVRLDPLVLSGDWRGAAELISLPFLLRTSDQTRVCVTRDDLRTVLTCYAAHLARTGATGLRRTVDSARFLSEDETEGFYITEVVRDDTLVVRPYPTRMRLRRSGGAWRVCETDSVVSNAVWPLVPQSGRPDVDASARPPAEP